MNKAIICAFTLLCNVALRIWMVLIGISVVICGAIVPVRTSMIVREGFNKFPWKTK